MNTKLKTKMTAPLRNRLLATAFCAVIASSLAQEARANNLVTDGTFLSYTGPGTAQIAAGSGFTQLTYWQTPLDPPNSYNSYNFLFLPGAEYSSPGAFDTFGNYVELYGPGNGYANGMPATDPGGGNFVALDSSFDTGAISQTISGLTSGNSYTLSFYWAAAQQYGKPGSTYDQLAVSLGASTQDTAQLNIAQGGFSGWNLDSMTFTATGSSELLSFLAFGGPNGTVPPFALLGDITLTNGTPTNPPSAPDSASTATLLGLALVAVGYAGRRGRWQRPQH